MKNFIELSDTGLIYQYSVDTNEILAVWELTGSFKYSPDGGLRIGSVKFPQRRQSFIPTTQVQITSWSSMHGEGEFACFLNPCNDGRYVERIVVFKMFLGNCQDDPDYDWVVHSCWTLEDGEWTKHDPNHVVQFNSHGWNNESDVRHHLDVLFRIKNK